MILEEFVFPVTVEKRRNPTDEKEKTEPARRAQNYRVSLRRRLAVTGVRPVHEVVLRPQQSVIYYVFFLLHRQCLRLRV